MKKWVVGQDLGAYGVGNQQELIVEQNKIGIIRALSKSWRYGTSGHLPFF